MSGISKPPIQDDAFSRICSGKVLDTGQVVATERNVFFSRG